MAASAKSPRNFNTCTRLRSSLLHPPCVCMYVCTYTHKVEPARRLVTIYQPHHLLQRTEWRNPTQKKYVKKKAPFSFIKEFSFFFPPFLREFSPFSNLAERSALPLSFSRERGVVDALRAFFTAAARLFLAARLCKSHDSNLVDSASSYMLV